MKEDLDIQVAMIQRRVAYHGVGTRQKLRALFNGLSVPDETVFRIVNGDVSRPNQSHLSSLQNRLDKKDASEHRSGKEFEYHDWPQEVSRGLEAARSQLQDVLKFEDFQPFAQFAEVKLEHLCWIRGGRYHFDGADIALRQVVGGLDQYLTAKKEGTVSQFHGDDRSQDQGSNGALKGISPSLMRSGAAQSALAASATAVVESPTAPQNGHQSPRSNDELALVARLERLGVATPRSRQRRTFMNHTGMAWGTLSKFLNGEGPFRPSTLQRIADGLEHVEEAFPVARDEPLPADQAAPQVDVEEDKIESEDSGDEGVSRGVLDQVADLLDIPLTDPHFETLFSANLSAMVRLARGQIDGVELKAVTLSDRLRWRLNIGDVDLP